MVAGINYILEVKISRTMCKTSVTTDGEPCIYHSEPKASSRFMCLKTPRNLKSSIMHLAFLPQCIFIIFKNHKFSITFRNFSATSLLQKSLGRIHVHSLKTSVDCIIIASKQLSLSIVQCVHLNISEMALSLSTPCVYIHKPVISLALRYATCSNRVE